MICSGEPLSAIAGSPPRRPRAFEQQRLTGFERETEADSLRQDLAWISTIDLPSAKGAVKGDTQHSLVVEKEGSMDLEQVSQEFDGLSAGVEIDEPKRPPWVGITNRLPSGAKSPQWAMVRPTSRLK